MNSTQAYLDQYYLNQTQFALHCELSPQDIEELVDAQLIPAPSYQVSESRHCKSVVFGELIDPDSVEELKAGSYFHPAAATWTRYAYTTLQRHPKDEAKGIVKRRFVEEFVQALAIKNNSTYRLKDCFNETGAALADGIAQRVNTNWQHFLNGVFSLCVAKPECIANIVHKEILQEKLSVITNNGSRVDYQNEDLATLKKLIDDYANSTMPFSPLEYPRSSRKRLVEDLRNTLSVL
ncbi:hypothetical protein H8K33_12070 [Undibacterium amnicola]|uniref:Uncharacterized protein n=1 Tax=Undibacterium amnicola TaxID=1834038 RepID=A0ABR6XTM5_9BURK|nr:DUF6058 family natural product biosynthesis protein [Undibacterium amnicola]MBC3832252.1 hypothetical protein [Undibacterium amnicola]